jgi:hypothetical protein
MDLCNRFGLRTSEIPRLVEDCSTKLFFSDQEEGVVHCANGTSEIPRLVEDCSTKLFFSDQEEGVVHCANG